MQMKQKLIMNDFLCRLRLKYYACARKQLMSMSDKSSLKELKKKNFGLSLKLNICKIKKMLLPNWQGSNLKKMNF